MSLKSKPEGIVPALTEQELNGAWPSEVAGPLSKAETLLEQGEAEQARELLARAARNSNSPWLSDALGVCQLRLNNAELALQVFRGLVVSGAALLLREDAPLAFKTNFATALLVTGNLDGCLRALREIADEGNPTVQRLRGAIRRWEEELSFWQKLGWWFGNRPSKPIALDFPLGNLR